MAKTAADYIAEGRALFAASADKTTPYPHAKSWQQRAVNQGFAEAFADEADKQAAAVKELQKRPFVPAAGGFQVPRAVLKHCNQLQAIAETSDDPARAARCALKVQTILGKWGKRAYAHQLRAGL